MYAFRATKPERLWEAADPVGPENDEWLCRLATDDACGAVVAAWGATGGRRVWPRIETVEAMFVSAGRRLDALGVTALGQPRHPLYVRADVERSSYGP